MSKMKQATLFSLKNWNKVTPEEIIKHKQVLDNPAGIAVIIRTLTIMKKRNPTKDVLLSTGIDVSLKKMVADHHSSTVREEVKKLMIQWKLEVPVKSQDVIVEKEKPLVVKEKSNDIVETIVANKEPDVKIVANLPDVSETASKKELSILKVVSKEVTKVKEVVSKAEEKEECKTNSAAQIYKMQTEKVICKKPVSEYKKKEINRRLQSAIALFMEELGKQEVKMYLDELNLKCCDY